MSVAFEHCLNNTYFCCSNSGYAAAVAKNRACGVTGMNPCIPGAYPSASYGSGTRTGYFSVNRCATVIPNCVGYAVGRFNEIINGGRQGQAFRYPWNGNGGEFYDHYKNTGELKVGQTPAVGAMICWGGSAGYGHVAIVEKVNVVGGKIPSIEISESGWVSGQPYFVNATLTAANGFRDGWRAKYALRGFIYPPNAVIPSATAGTIYSGGAVPESHVSGGGGTHGGGGTGIPSQPIKKPKPQYTLSYKTVTTDVSYDKITTVDNAGHGKSVNLLTYPTLVESPFIIVKIGNYTFGSFSKAVSGNNISLDYPNYVTGLNIVKVNGSVNQYQLELTYQIQAGEDPNFLDKVLSSIGYGNIKLSYGDWSAPSFIYREEEALITNVTTNVDFASAKIIYRISCTSTCLPLASASCDFSAQVAKPSDVIKDMLFGKNSSKYGLLDAFPGFKTRKNEINNYIASDDRAVKLEAKSGTDPLSYLNYLVSCMIASTNSASAILLDSSYYLTIQDDAFSEGSGTYFTVTKVPASNGGGNIKSSDIYEVDINYPDNTMVTSFQVNSDNSWALLYKYSDSLSESKYKYKLNKKGEMISIYSPGLTTSGTQNLTTSSAKTWWTNMTQFPISATLVIKGLIRPAMLMTYVRINAFFYGQRHIASGIYIITKQEDQISGQGYRTTLTLLRVAGDNDIIQRVTEKVTTKVPVWTKVGDSAAHTSGGSADHGGGGHSFEKTTSHTSGGGGSHGGGGH